LESDNFARYANTVANNADLLQRFDGELLLFHSTYADEAQQLFDGCAGIKEIVCIDGDCGVGTSLETWSTDTPHTFTADGGRLDKPFTIFGTGGTTGKPKGVILSHRNVHTFFSNFYAHFNYHDHSWHLVGSTDDPYRGLDRLSPLCPWRHQCRHGQH
jgi:acyl-CoA synthetase (AMP-forming)/AMP-acid ligase II